MTLSPNGSVKLSKLWTSSTFYISSSSPYFMLSYSNIDPLYDLLIAYIWLFSKSDPLSSLKSIIF